MSLLSSSRVGVRASSSVPCPGSAGWDVPRGAPCGVGWWLLQPAVLWRRVPAGSCFAQWWGEAASWGGVYTWGGAGLRVTLFLMDERNKCFCWGRALQVGRWCQTVGMKERKWQKMLVREIILAIGGFPRQVCDWPFLLEVASVWTLSHYICWTPEDILKHCTDKMKYFCNRKSWDIYNWCHILCVASTTKMYGISCSVNCEITKYLYY